MNKSFLLVSYCLFVSVLSCFGQKISDRETNWINVEYLQCMKNRLPCECAGNLLCFSIAIQAPDICKNETYEDYESENEKKYGVLLNNTYQNEPIYCEIIQEDSNRYKITGYDINDKIILAELFIERDTLCLIENNLCSKFVRSIVKNFDEDHYYLDNVHLLNIALSLRGYQSMEKILKVKNLHFSCQIWWGSSNILHMDNKPLYWSLEIINGYLHIKKVLNPMRDPFTPLKLKEIKRLKWDILDIKD